MPCDSAWVGCPTKPPVLWLLPGWRCCHKPRKPLEEIDPRYWLYATGQTDYSRSYRVHIVRGYQPRVNQCKNAKGYHAAPDDHQHGQFVRQQRFDNGPCKVGQFITAACHTRLHILEALKHKLGRNQTTFMSLRPNTEKCFSHYFQLTIF